MYLPRKINRRRRWPTFALALAAASTTARDAAGQIVASWIGNAGNWSDATNWSTAPDVPNNSGGSTYDVVIDNPNAAVTLDTDNTINDFTLNDGALNGDHTLNIVGASASWSGGAIAGIGTLNIGTSSSPTSFALNGSDRVFSNYTLNIGSLTTTTWTAGDINSDVVVEGGTFNNSGTFNDATDNDWNWQATQTPTFNNLAGATFTKTVGTVQVLQPVFNNDGTVSVQQGILQLAGGGTSSGTFLVAAGAQLLLSDLNENYSTAGAPTTVLDANSVINAQGRVAFFQFFGDSHTDVYGKMDVVDLVSNPGLTGEVNFHSGSVIGGNFTGGLEVDSGTMNMLSGSVGTFDNINFFGGTVSLSGGSINNAITVLAHDTDSTGTAILTGVGSSWTMSSFLQVGASGAGTLLVQNGAHLSDTVGDSAVFDPGSSASILVDGAGSRWDNSDYLRIANAGQATLTISNSAIVTCVNEADIAASAGSAGTVNISSSGQLNVTGFVSLGDQGAGTMMICGGGTVSSTQGYLGSGSMASGVATVSGAGSRWDNSDFLDIGGAGAATLTINSGATVTSTSASLADQLGSSAVINISGTGSNWTLSDYLTAGGFGNCTISLQSGGQLSDTGTQMAIDPSSTANATITGSGSKWTLSQFLYVGTNGTCTLLASNGGHVQTGDTSAVGVLAGSVGTVIIDGAGSRWDGAAGMVVAYQGTGTLIISNGGVVTDMEPSSTTGASAIIGSNGNGSGTVLVSGNGSTWNCDGQLDVGFGSFLSTDTPGGTGYLSVNSGGAVSSTDGFIGQYPGGKGTVIIGGTGSGSNWTLTGSLYLGGGTTSAVSTAFGTLTVNSGGTVTVPNEIQIWNNGTLQWNDGSISTATLNLTGGGKALLASGADKILRVNSLSIDTANGSKLDLNDNSAIIDYTGASPASTIRTALIAGRNGGAFTGNGITSSAAATVAADNANIHKTALGYGEASAILGAGGGMFLDQSVDGTAVLIRYTLLGDNNLDGSVNSDDFDLLAAHFGETGGVWTDGDYNYDGTVNALDFNALATNYGATLASDLPANLPSAASPLGTLVPEPASASLLPLLLLSLHSLSNRKRASA